MVLKSLLFNYLRSIYYRSLRAYYFLPHRRILHKIRKEDSVNVFFLISSLPMWRLQSLYDLLVKDSRYNLSIILLPFDTFSTEEQRSCMTELRDYFDIREITYIDVSKEEISAKRWKEMNPQIIFYQQMYSTIYHSHFSLVNNLNKLICYLPYGIITIKGDWIYNTKFTNLAWRLFYPTELHVDYAKSHSFNHAKNVRAVGEPDAALFMEEGRKTVCSDDHIKRVVWAPHYSVVEGGMLHRASFLWLADEMQRLVKEYDGKVFFILKPHPRLISTLYSLPEWGKEKTDAYFESWSKGSNTELVTGQYIDIFKSSDAMIHDCGSFTAEYLYTGNPVMFISSDFNHVYEGLDYFGTKCLDLHYHGSDKKDIVYFLDNVVLKNEDPMEEKRKLFRDGYLMQNGSCSVGKAIYDTITSDIFKY